MPFTLCDDDDSFNFCSDRWGKIKTTCSHTYRTHLTPEKVSNSNAVADCGKSATIGDLPLEVLVRIFSLYVESEGNAKLCTILQKVSMSWWKASLTPSLWTEVRFIAEDFIHGHSWLNGKDILEPISLLKTLNFCYMLASADTLDESLHAALFTTLALEQILKNSWNLENLNLNCHFTDIPHSSFDLPTLCPKITGIQIAEVPRIAANHMLLNWIESYNVNLTKLIIRHVLVEPFALAALSQKIAECCPNMTTFEFTPCVPVNRFDINSIQAKCPKIKKLCLGNMKLTGIDHSTSCVLQLEKFCYGDRFSSPANIQQDIVWILKGSNRLEELKLVGLDLEVESMLQLPYKFLKKLSIWHHGDNTHDLYNILCHWKHSLTKLNAQCNKNSQESLFRYIKQYGKDKLESLSLVCFHSFKIMQIKRVLRHCGKLTFLRIITYPHSIHHPILLNSKKKINEWLDH